MTSFFQNVKIHTNFAVLVNVTDSCSLRMFQDTVKVKNIQFKLGCNKHLITLLWGKNE